MPPPSFSSTHTRSSPPSSFLTLLRSSLSCLTPSHPPTPPRFPLILLLLFLSLSLGSLFLAAPSSPAASDFLSGGNARAPGLAGRGMAAASASAAAAGGAGAVVADERAGDAVVVYITVPNKETGQKLAASLVGAKLAACVNRVPGEPCTREWGEWLLL
ncbi:unnamed protein product [Closterium sp. NIES-54]